MNTSILPLTQKDAAELRAKIPELIGDMCWEWIMKTMDALEWKYARNGLERVTKEMAIACATDNLESAIKLWEESPDSTHTRCSSGGFVAEAFFDESLQFALRLSFEVESVTTSDS